MLACRSTWAQSVLPRLTAATGIGYVATAYTVSRWLTRRSPARVDPPRQLRHATCETVVRRTSDGVQLHGWVITPRAPRATVALFHGLRANRSQLLDRIAFLCRAGYRCVAFDHRAHGHSAGRCTSFGYHERHDVAAVVDLLEQRWPGAPRAALGVSMGAAAVCFGAGRSHSFDAFVLESVYCDLATAFESRVGQLYPGWFEQFRRGIIWITERRLRTRIDTVAPIDHIGSLSPHPILLVTGSDDPYAPPDKLRELYDRCTDPRNFHIVPAAGHANVCQTGGRDYEELVIGFLARHL